MILQKILLVMLILGPVEHAAGEEATPDDVRAIVEYLASDGIEGRLPGSASSGKARTWLINWLKREGFYPAGTNAGSFEQHFKSGVNLLALSQAPEQGEAQILFSAHYDHHGYNCKPHDKAQSAVCNGAADNAAGVAVALLAAKRFKEISDIPVAVALWDAEEQGLKGSLYFVLHPSFPTATLKLMINFDIIGLNIFKGLENHHFAVGADSGGAALQEDLRVAAQKITINLKPVSYAFGHLRSDMSSFVLAGYKLPFVFFSDGDGSVYHTTADESQNINYKKSADIVTLAADLALQAVERQVPYLYVKPKLTLGVAAPDYHDAVPLLATIDEVIANAEANNLGAGKVRELHMFAQDLHLMIAEGAARFDMLDAIKLMKAGKGVFAISRALAEIP